MRGVGANEAEKRLQKDGTQPKGPWKEVGQGERKALTGRRPPFRTGMSRRSSPSCAVGSAPALTARPVHLRSSSAVSDSLWGMGLWDNEAAGSVPHGREMAAGTEPRHTSGTGAPQDAGHRGADPQWRPDPLAPQDRGRHWAHPTLHEMGRQPVLSVLRGGPPPGLKGEGSWVTPLIAV